MSSTRLGNRLGTLEQKATQQRAGGAVHICVPPGWLSKADYDAWAAEQKRNAPEGTTPLLVRFVKPGEVP
jgi:hypothetical protein